MAAEAPRGDGGDGPRMKLLCSHGGRLLPRGPDGAVRYAGGETRVLAVLPRARREAGGDGRRRGGARGSAPPRGRGPRGRVMSVTCDEELAHMRDEYDRLRAARPAARFRVFVTTAAAAGGGASHGGRPSAAAGLPPLASRMRRVQSEQAQLHQRPTHKAPVRRVQSAQEFAARLHVQPSFHHRRQQQCCCGFQRRELCSASGRMVCADAAREMARSRDSQAAMENSRRAIWEFE
ncbi:hypothetical protein C2845_PM01G31860 [Panicum miliaceum]|uniref:Uncharacterized protein n=1 Tax=Panicum miliaceum TaxID=4540 RepID=A0A3L6TMT0_PANMI|nr:hypothetical protein C2845_PM01G31860 [Panicum miliaceum]